MGIFNIEEMVEKGKRKCFERKNSERSIDRRGIHNEKYPDFISI
jgi:hypothetical protein